jgi:hypothetical protein
MESLSTNLELVINKINSIKSSDKNIQKAKKQRIEFYKSYENRINSLDIDKINCHNFINEVLDCSQNILKLECFNKSKYKMIDKLEIHRYAPELNKLLFKNGKEIKTPQIDNIENAIAFIIKNQSLEQIKSI